MKYSFYRHIVASLLTCIFVLGSNNSYAATLTSEIIQIDGVDRDQHRVGFIDRCIGEGKPHHAQIARTVDEHIDAAILVDGHAMLLRGMNQIDNFADNASRAVREAKTALLDQ